MKQIHQGVFKLSHEPKHYNLPDHLAKIFRSPEFAAAAKEAGLTAEAFQHDVTLALKALTEEQRQAELKAFEKHLGDQAVSLAVEKLKAGVEIELKELLAKHRADELAAHEKELAIRAISAAAKKARSAA